MNQFKVGDRVKSIAKGSWTEGREGLVRGFGEGRGWLIVDFYRNDGSLDIGWSMFEGELSLVESVAQEDQDISYTVETPTTLDSILQPDVTHKTIWDGMKQGIQIMVDSGSTSVDPLRILFAMESLEKGFGLGDKDNG